MCEKKMSIKEAAAELGKNQQFVRIGLQRGILTFGVAQKLPGKDKYDYFISPVQFYKYIGKELPDKYREPKDQTGIYKVITDPYMSNQSFYNWGK